MTPAEVAPLIDKVYEFSCVGGNAHIVLDDCNVEDEHILWCLNIGMAQNAHEACAEQLAAERACLEAMLQLTEKDRWSAIALHEGFPDDFYDETESGCHDGIEH